MYMLTPPNLPKGEELSPLGGFKGSKIKTPLHEILLIAIKVKSSYKLRISTIFILLLLKMLVK